MEMAGKEAADELLKLLEKELIFSNSRSSGPGGQHVNKVNTRVELKFHVDSSAHLTEDQKFRINSKLKNRITNEGYLVLASQEERSQARNKQLVTDHFFDLITKALKPAKKRKPTQPSPQSAEKRLEEKRKTSERKKARKKPGEDPRQ